MKMKRLFVMLLAIVCIFCISCKKEPQISDNESQELSAVDYMSDLYVEDYDGYNFRILIRHGKRLTSTLGSTDPIYNVGYATGVPLGYTGNKLANSQSAHFSSHYAANEAAQLERLKDFN